MRVLILLSAVIGTMLAESAALAQNYPSRPIRLLVPYAAGNAADITARGLGTELARQLGQQVVIDNRPGASGIISYEMLARAAPDGHTIGFLGSTFAANPYLFTKLAYDSVRDFQPIIQASASPNVVVASLSFSARTLRELLDQARAKPGVLAYGGGSIGGSSHFAMELLKLSAGIDLMFVSYKGAQQALTDVLGGQIHLMCDAIGSISPHVRAGKVRGLGVTTSKRSPALPDVPTVAEGGVAGYEFTNWGGIAGPVGMQRDVAARLNNELNKAVQSPAVATAMIARGSIPVGGTAQQFAEFLRIEFDKHAKIVKAAGIKPQ